MPRNHRVVVAVVTLLLALPGLALAQQIKSAVPDYANNRLTVTVAQPGTGSLVVKLSAFSGQMQVLSVTGTSTVVIQAAPSGSQVLSGVSPGAYELTVKYDSGSDKFSVSLGQPPAAPVEVAAGYSILGETSTAPAGYVYSGRSILTDGAPVWSPRQALPSPRDSFHGAALDGAFFVFGGRQGGGKLSDVLRYDPLSNAWTAKASLPQPRDYYACAVVNGKAYVLGGNIVDFNTAYDPATDTWTAKAPVPSTRWAAAAAAVGTRIYLTGGVTSGYSANNDVYDTATDTWSTGAPLPQVLCNHAAVTLDGKVHVLGGTNPAGDLVDLHQVYDPATNAWATLPPLPAQVHEPRAFAIGSAIWMLGGTGNPGGQDRVATVRVWEAGAWREETPMSLGRAAFAAAVLNGRIHVAGGEVVPAGTPTASQERLDVQTRYYIHRRQ